MKKIAKIRALYGSIAGVLCVALVGTSIHFTSERAHAKETFQGITDIVMDNMESNPFQIIEMVPGTAQYTVTSLDGEEPVTLDLSLGELGYYIDGYEPAAFDEQIKLLKSGEQRRNYANALLSADDNGNLVGGSLYNITSQERDNTKALHYVKYEEAYNVSDNAVAQSEEEGNPWKLLESENASTEQLVNDGHMVKAKNGLYLKTYSPKVESADAIRDIKNRFILFMDMNSNTAGGMHSGNKIDGLPFTVSENLAGDFDPSFKYDGDAGTWDVIFEKNNGNFGYVIKDIEPAYKDKLPANSNIYEEYTAGGKTYYQFVGKVYQPEVSALLPEAPATGAVGVEDEVVDDDTEEEEVSEDEDADVSGDEETEDMPDSVEDDGNNDGEESGNDSETVYDDNTNDDSSNNDSSNDDSSNDDSSNNDSSNDNSSNSDSSNDDSSNNDSSDDSEKKSDDSEKKSDDSEPKSDDSAKADIVNRPVAAHDEAESVSVKDKLDDFIDSIDVEDEEIETEEMDEIESVEEYVNAVEEDDFDESELFEEEPVEVTNPDEVTGEDAVVGVGTGKYFTILFGYDSKNPVDSSSCAYSVKAWQVLSTDTTNYPYALTAENEDAPGSFVVPNYGGTGSLIGVGQEDFLYTYKEPEAADDGNLVYRGNYNLVDKKDSDPDETYRIKGVDTYYRGVYENMDYFTQFVFDRDIDASFNPIRDMFYSYTTMTPAEISSQVQVENIGLIYLSAGRGEMLPEGAVMPADYSKENDISVGTMAAIINAVVDDDLPVMADYSLLDSKYDGTNIQKLVKVLNAEDYVQWHDEHQNSLNDYINNLDLIAGFPAPKQFSDAPKDHHVNRSVYIYNYSLHPTNSVNIDFLTASDEYGQVGFDEIREQIDDENKYRELDSDNKSTGSISRTVNEAVAIKYIISFRGRKSAYVKESIRVLELQPGAVPGEKYDEDDDDKYDDPDKYKEEGHLYVTKTKNKKNNDVYNLCVKHYDETGTEDDGILLKELPNEIIVDSMSTSAFVGRLADLNSTYDLIYIGLATTHFNTDSDDRTEYNDSDMDGLLYTNIGDEINVEPRLRGLVDGESQNMRGSGTDISKTTLAALKEYVDGGYPVLVARNCFFGDDSDETVYDGPVSGTYEGDKRGYIDNCSYMYQFLDYAADKYGVNEENFFRLNEAACVPQRIQKTFEWYLNLPKPEIVLDPGYARTEGYNDAEQAGTDFYFNYRFEIKDKRSTNEDDTYHVELFVDVNGDGKYSDDENQDEISVSGTSGSVGRENGRYKLKTGKSYRLSYKCDDELAGPKSWKLRVSINPRSGLLDRVAKARRDEKIGVHFIDRRPSPDSKRVIRILQIYADNYAGNHNWPNIEEGGNQADWISGADSAFRKAISKVDDFYEVPETVAMSSKEFVDKIDEDPDYIEKEGFNTLILGFSDFYNAFDDSASEDKKDAARRAADLVLAWMEEGNSTMIGSDVVGEVNIEDKTTYENLGSSTRGLTWYGYYDTRRFRTIIGQDRFGILQQTDVGMQNNGMGNLLKGGSANYSSLKSRNEYDVAYGWKPNSGDGDPNSGDICKSVQGYTNQLLDDCRTKTANQHKVGVEDSVNGGFWKEMGTSELEFAKVNEGVITKFPNNLSKAYAGSNYYKLPVYSLDLQGDYDFDEQPDVTVWYAYTNGNEAIRGMSGDTRNLYYLATKRNITFINLIMVPHTVEQMDLFVNALIATFEAGPSDPTVRIVDQPDIDAPDAEVIYIPYETITDTNSILYDEETGKELEDVYYYSTRSARGTSMLSRYFYCADQSEIITKTEDGVTKDDDDAMKAAGWTRIEGYWTKPLTVESVINTTTNTPPGTLTHHYIKVVKGVTVLDEMYVGYDTTADTPYDIKVPLGIMKTEAGVDLNERRVLVQTISFVPGNTSKKPLTAYDSVRFVRTELFNLD